MPRIKNTLMILIIIFLFQQTLFAQIPYDEPDKCGYNHALAKATLADLGPHWGYSYDSLLTNLQKWSESPYIRIDSLGASVQNRAIWQLTVTAEEVVTKNKQTVFIHARTHPGEVQSWWVTEQLINQLISESDVARALREQCVFYIVPMYNPDGVELEYPRENANGIDIESNWNKDPVQPEVAVLRNRFSELMASASPIKVAMNMHSAYGQKRFFVYHDSTGTSPEFNVLEQQYIEGVRFYYPDGIEPWYFRITWKNGTPPYYPESWFWLNHQEAVMALTYEDWNDAAAHSFDLTANALLNGIADYLDVDVTTLEEAPAIVRDYNLLKIYPNPFNPATTIEYSLQHSGRVKLTLYNMAGNNLGQLLNENKAGGLHRLVFNGSRLASGMYIIAGQVGSRQTSKKMLLLK